MKKVNFEVAGMSCGHCVHAVREAAASVDGVTVEAISIGSVAVALDESKATIGQVVDAIADAGYDATEVAAA